VIPLALAASHSKHVTLREAVAGEAVAGTVLGLVAVLLARGARRRVERTLSRPGERTAKAGRWLGLLGFCAGITAALALGFFGLLLLIGG
jgi:hypothetical protein